MPSGAVNYNPDAFDRLRPVEDTHFWFVGRNNVVAAALATLAANAAASRAVLEIGCGTGNTLRVLREIFPHARLVGMDAFHGGLLHARHRTNASMVEARIEHMPFRTPFSLIGMFDVLEHIEDEAAAVAAVHASLEAGGRFVVTVPANPSLWSRFDEECHHQRRYTESHLRQVLAGARFEVEYVTHFMSATYPALWASRRAERWLSAVSRANGSAGKSAIDRELAVPRLVNAVFRQLLRLEPPFVKRRYRLPVGTSLLAIARS
jgi:SAM-dependent methyltransferase